MKSLFLRVYDFLYVLTLPRKHKRNIKSSKKILSKIKEIASSESGEAKSISYLRKIDSYVFEELILSSFEEKGFRVKRGRRYSGDGGFDGHVFLGEWIPIQCKRYENSINPKHVEEFSSLTKKGLFVHTGRTGNKSKENAGEEIIFLSGSYLIAFLKSENKEICSFWD